MQVKMVTTTGRLPVIETALLEMEENQVRLKEFFQHFNQTPGTQAGTDFSGLHQLLIILVVVAGRRELWITELLLNS